jgi:hypothetical protein
MVTREELNDLFNMRANALGALKEVEQTAFNDSDESKSECLMATSMCELGKLLAVSDRRLEILCELFMRDEPKIIVPGEDG